MWKNRKNLKRVETWYDTPYSELTPTALQQAFQNGTGIGSPISYFFADIWVPFAKRKGGDGSDKHDIVPGEYVYQNVGFTNEEIATIYWAQYRSLFLSEPLDTTDASTVGTSTAHLGKIIKAILTKNKYKYLKWIDEMGYAYNPLWNVDGVEEYQWIDNHGNIVRDNVPILPYISKLKTNSYAGDEKDTSSTYNAYGGIKKNGDTEQYTVSDGSAESVYELRSRDTETHEDITGAEPASITGTIMAITGGDFSHIEKRVRQGNIGVTKSTELIESERELVRFNLLQEFFNDINKEILIGVYI